MKHIWRRFQIKRNEKGNMFARIHRKALVRLINEVKLGKPVMETNKWSGMLLQLAELKQTWEISDTVA